MSRSQHRQVERLGALRGRLIASILVAGLLPFFAAWWIANAYVADQARTNAEVRLSFSARSAAREATALLRRRLPGARARTEREAPARRPSARPAGAGAAARAGRGRVSPGTPAWRGDDPRRLGGSTNRRRAGGPRRGPRPDGAWRRSRSRPRRAGASRPRQADGPGGHRRRARADPCGIVVAGPAEPAGRTLGADGGLQSGDDAFRAQSVVLPGYDPPVRIVAAADGSVAGDDPRALRGRSRSPLSSPCSRSASTQPLSRGRCCGASTALPPSPSRRCSIRSRVRPTDAGSSVRSRSSSSDRPGAASVRPRDRRPRRLQARQRPIRPRSGGRGARDVGRAAPGLVRSADTVARLGGEEFALLLPETGLAGALAVAERARARSPRAAAA